VHPTLAPLPASWPAPGDPLPEALSQEGSFRALGRDMLLFAFHFQQARDRLQARVRVRIRARVHPHLTQAQAVIERPDRGATLRNNELQGYRELGLTAARIRLAVCRSAQLDCMMAQLTTYYCVRKS